MKQARPRTKRRPCSAKLLRLHQPWCRSNFATNFAFRTLESTAGFSWPNQQLGIDGLKLCSNRPGFSFYSLVDSVR
jgi:hypothetical protein